MPCKIQITKEITSLVEKQTEPFMGLSLKLANKKVEKVNKFFRAKVAEFVMIGDIMDRIITIPESLVQIYYNNELKIEEREAAKLLKEEKEKERKYVESKKKEWEQNREYFENDEPFTRASDVNTQDTLFGLDEENKNLEFNITTLNAISNFFQNIGVEKTFIPSFLNKDGSIIKGAIAAANFIKGTIDISENERTNILNNTSLSDEEKSVKISEFWKKVDSKLPEEAAHWWYRLLSTNSELKKALWLSSQTAEKNNELYGTKYGKLEGINNPEDLTEESIGQLIAEAIKRIEEKNANISDYSFFKKFLEWINSIIDMFDSTEQDPFEVAAMKILSSDLSDLISLEDYIALTTENVGEAINPVSDISVTDEKVYKSLIKRLSKKKRSPLPKTIEKLKLILSKASLTTEKLTEENKKTLDVKDYIPSLLSFNKFTTKFKKGIPTKDNLALDGVKAFDTMVYNAVRALILSTDDFKEKTIIPYEDFIFYLNEFLEKNYLINFQILQGWENYKIDNTFKDKTARHRKIGLRFNNEYFQQTSHFGFSPLAWGNITYFKSDPSMDEPDSALIHEIQNDFWERLGDITGDVEKNMNLERALKLPTLFRNLPKDTKLAYTQFKQKIEEYKNLKKSSGLDLQKTSALKRIKELNHALRAKLPITPEELTKLYNQLQEEANTVNPIDGTQDPYVHLYISKSEYNFETGIYENSNIGLNRIVGKLPSLVSFKRSRLPKSEKQLAYLLKLKENKQISKILVYEKSQLLKIFQQIAKYNSAEDYDKLSFRQFEKIYNNIQYNKSFYETLIDIEANTNKRNELYEKYFTPLVHHLLQTVIEEKGKSFKVYFPGKEIVLLSQVQIPNEKTPTPTADLYATPEDVTNGKVSKIGVMFNNFKKIHGISLEYKPEVEGFIKPVDAYQVNLKDYTFDNPIMFGLDLNEEEPNIKPGVEELFESNKDLANEVYSALGFESQELKDLSIDYPVEVSFYKDNDKVLLTEVPRWYDLKNNSLALIAIADKLGVNSSNFSKAYNEHRNQYKAFKAYLTSEDISDETTFYKKKDGKTYFVDKNGEEQKAHIEYGDENFISEEASKNTKEFVEKREINFQSMNTYKKWVDSLKKIQENIKSKLTVSFQQKQQAQSKFQEYVNATGKQDIEGFKEFVTGEKIENIDSLKELLDNEKLEYQDAILIDLINKVAPNQESLPTTEEVVEELPSQQSIDGQKQNNSYSDLVSTIKGLMNTLGVKIVKVEAIYLKQQEINTLYNKLASSKNDVDKQIIQKQIDELKREGVRKNVLGLADTLNGVINLALSENNIDESEFALNEEMLHFIVDIIEQKYPDLYKELLQKVGTYNLYNQMYKIYSLQKKYQNEDESVNVNKIKKEAVAKVLNDFLTNSEYSEEDYQLSKTQLLWNKIKDTLRDFFQEKNNNIAANNFRFTLDRLLNDPNFITKEDAKLLSGDEFFGIMGTISSVMMGKEAAFSTKNFLSPLDFVKHVLEIKANSSKVYVDKNTNKITSPTEPNSVERYTIKTPTGVVIVGSRVSDFVTKFLDKIFPNNTSKNNKELELAAERGVIIHNIFELTFTKYVDPATGIVRKQPINSSPQLEIYEKRYAKEEGLSMPVKIDKYVQELIALYPNSYFLTEVPIFNKSLTVGGTIDLMIVDANKKVHIYDWKTKKADVHKGQGIIQKRDKIDPWNIKAWRIQLDAYMDILKYNYNVESFGRVRMIPIMTEFESNGTTISNINIGSEKTPDIRQRQLLAVPSKQELTGLSETDKLIKANYKLAEKLQIQANKVSDMGEKEKLRLESSVLEDLAIDLQVGKGIQSLVNKLEQILKIHDDIIEKDRNGEIKSSDLPIIASAIVDLSIYNTDSRLINVAEELFSKFDSLSDLQKETKKELQDLSVNVSNKITELKKVLINSAELFGNDQGIYDINKVENEIENTAGLLSFAGILARRNSIYQLNFKTGQLFANLVRGVQNQIERERITVRNTLEKIKVDYLKDFGGILKSDESIFSILFRYPTEEEIKNGAIDGPKLVAKIDKKFYSTLKEQKEHFVNLINASIKTKKDFTKSASYTELLKWLEDNIHLEEWKKHYATRKENQKNLLETQYSYIRDEEERDYTIQQALTSWEYRNNILKSPGAFNSNNISAFINEEKWLSSDYKKIKSSPSALAAYNAFREIMFNARRVGYIQDLSQISEIPTNITTKNKLAYYYSLVKLHGNLKYLYFNSIPEVLKNMLIKPLENNLALEDIKNGFSNINPITQEEELELPVYMLRDFNVQIDKEGRLKSLKDLDLFKVYEELAFHVINFQNLSATEELADAIIMVEESKNFEKQMNAQGNTNENKKIVKQTKTKEDILKHTKNFIWYNKSKEKEKTTVFNFSVNKIVDTVKSYAAALYLGFNHALAYKALTVSTLSSFSNAGDVYSKRDVLFAPLKRVISSSLIEKSFSYHVSSSTLHENRLKNNNYVKKLAIFGREYLLNSLSVVDYEIQKNLFYASLPNFTIIEEGGVKKIVNIDRYVDNKYPDIYKETPEKRKEIFEKKNKEKEELKKNNLGVQLQERAKKSSGNDMSLDLSDIDTKSIDQFTNIVQETSKRVLGNMSDKDIYLWKTGNLMTLLTQFKSFAFKIFDVRWGDIKYNSPLERHTYGKFRALSTFMLTNQQTINENNEEILRTKVTAATILSGITRFLHVVAPFLNVKEQEDIIQILKVKYLQYAITSKNKNESTMSEKEYIEMYLTELTSAKNELYILLLFAGLLTFAAGGDDDEDSWWLKYIKNIIRGATKELLFPLSPNQMSSMGALSFPGLGALATLFNAFSFQFGNVVEFTTDSPLYIKVDPFQYTLGERLSPIIKATPYVRPTSALLAEYSQDWRHFLNVDKKSRSLVKNRLK